MQSLSFTSVLLLPPPVLRSLLQSFLGPPAIWEVLKKLPVLFSGTRYRLSEAEIQGHVGKVVGNLLA